MSAQETIQAAIDKLEGLRDYFYSEGERAWRVEVPSVGKTASIFDEQDMVIARFTQPADAALIVTLHRTIDAQLAILRTSLTLDGLVPMDQVLDLARAIVGEVTSDAS